MTTQQPTQLKHETVLMRGGKVAIAIHSLKVLRLYEDDLISEEGGYQPAKSMFLQGEDVIALRDLLNKTFPPGSEV